MTNTNIQAPTSKLQRNSKLQAPTPVHAWLQSQRDCVLQPRVARHELPWVADDSVFNPNGVAPCCRRQAATPLGLLSNRTISQGSSSLATLGCKPESLWDSIIAFSKDIRFCFGAWMGCILTLFLSGSLSSLGGRRGLGRGGLPGRTKSPSPRPSPRSCLAERGSQQEQSQAAPAPELAPNRFLTHFISLLLSHAPVFVPEHFYLIL